jgi:hypothetical protein
MISTLFEVELVKIMAEAKKDLLAHPASKPKDDAEALAVLKQNSLNVWSIIEKRGYFLPAFFAQALLQYLLLASKVV